MNKVTAKQSNGQWTVDWLYTVYMLFGGQDLCIKRKKKMEKFLHWISVESYRNCKKSDETLCVQGTNVHVFISQK